MATLRETIDRFLGESGDQEQAFQALVRAIQKARPFAHFDVDAFATTAEFQDPDDGGRVTLELLKSDKVRVRAGHLEPNPSRQGPQWDGYDEFEVDLQNAPIPQVVRKIARRL